MLKLKKISKIVVIKNNFIGDTVLTVPFLRNLHYNYPDAKIDIVVDEISSNFLKHCPYINELIILQKPKDTRKKVNIFKLSNALRAQKYDVAFLLKRSFSSALASFLAFIPNRVGYNTDFRRLLLSRAVNYDPLKHEVDCFMDILRAWDIPIKDYYLESWTGEEEQVHIDSLLSEKDITGKFFILINAATTNKSKMWPIVNYSKVITSMVNDFDGQIFFVGAQKDKDIYNEIEKQTRNTLKHTIVNLIGKTTVVESLELIKRMKLVISIDSGIIHLAASANIPTIAIFGPMNDIKWAPYSECKTVLTAPVECRPCNLHKNCSEGLVCLSSISPNNVIAAAAKYLKASNANIL